jgi:hypothetical protein
MTLPGRRTPNAERRTLNVEWPEPKDTNRIDVGESSSGGKATKTGSKS